MYPSGELVQLAERKRRLVEQSDTLRAQALTTGMELEKPFLMAERAGTLWQKLSLLFTPVSMALEARGTTPKALLFKAAVRYAPRLFSVAKKIGMAALMRARRT